jgi:hypothetical protein
MRPRLLLSLALLAIGGFGCATDGASRRPLGIPEQDWSALTPEQRLQAHFKQVEVNQAERKQKQAEATKVEAEPRKTEPRDNAPFGVAYGERVQCLASPLSVHHGGKWHKAEPLVIDVAGAQVAEVSLTAAEPAGKEIPRRIAHASFTGKLFSLCPSGDAPTKAACVQLLGTFEDYRRGISQTVDKPNFVRGKLRCTLGPGDGMPAIVGRAAPAAPPRLQVPPTPPRPLAQ